MDPSTSLQKGRDCPSPQVLQRSWDPAQLWGSMRKPGPVKLELPHHFLGKNLSANLCLSKKATWNSKEAGEPCSKQERILTLDEWGNCSTRGPPGSSRLGDTSAPACPPRAKLGSPLPLPLPSPGPPGSPRNFSTSPIDRDTSNDVTMGHRAAFWGPHPEEVLSWLCITNSTVRRQRMDITRALSRVSMVKFVSYSQGFPHLKPVLDSSQWTSTASPIH